MAGMLTGDRMVRLEVAGICQQSISHTSNYSMTVPYRSMSQTMQNISRMGGKVVGVHVSDGAPAAAPSATTEAAPAEDKNSSNGKKGKKK